MVYQQKMYQPKCFKELHTPGVRTSFSNCKGSSIFHEGMKKMKSRPKVTKIFWLRLNFRPTNKISKTFIFYPNYRRVNNI